MTDRELTAEQMEQRFAQIDAQTPEVLTDVERASLAAAEAMDDGSVQTLEALRRELDGYSGKLVLRIPRSLHKSLAEAAAAEGVSLNQYIRNKLSR